MPNSIVVGSDEQTFNDALFAVTIGSLPWITVKGFEVYEPHVDVIRLSDTVTV